jgi:hypothetical protein
MDTPSLPKHALLDRMVAMMHQEETSYRYDIYLTSSGGLDIDESQLTNITWRENICQWSYNVVDHFDLPRELAAISLNLFDRFLATRGNRCSGNMALLASLTTLHIAIKIHAEKRVKISTFANLSRGQFGAHHIEEMEWQVLSALGWKLHPPTLFAFISYFLLLLPNEAPHHTVRKELFELSIYMAELSVCDSFFVKFKASTVAFAAIMNVVEEMPFARFSAGTRETFLRELVNRLGLTCRSPDVMAARDRLKAIFTTALTVVSNDVIDTINGRSSPCTTVDEETTSMSVSSTGSGSSSSRNNMFCGKKRSTPGSVDSKGGSVRLPSSSPGRRLVVVASPMVSSRSRTSSSASVAGIQYNIPHSSHGESHSSNPRIPQPQSNNLIKILQQ